MITIGAYVDGSDPRIDQAKQLMPGIQQFLRQDISQKISYEMSLDQLKKVYQD